jgi:arginine exporter protein ArgO
MKTFLKQNWFKILAIVFLLGAVGNWPYGYYQLLRWAILIIGAYSVYLAYEIRKISWAWIFGIIAVLFNPIIPITFSKDIWQIIDIIVAIIFFISLFAKNKLITKT